MIFNHQGEYGKGDNILVFDIETDGLLEEATKVHCMVISDLEGNYNIYDPEHKSIEEGLELLNSADAIVAHNGIGFDAPCLTKLYTKEVFHPKRVEDTMIYSRLVFQDEKGKDYSRHKKGYLPPKLIGSHSLKAWGYRLGEFKGDYGEKEDAWAEWSPEMTEYCVQDVRVLLKLYLKCRENVVSWDAVELEHKTAEIIERQMNHGFLFDVEKCQRLHVQLLERKEELESSLVNSFGTLFVKNGGGVFTPKKTNPKKGYIAGASMCKIKEVPFNPGSRAHCVRMLHNKYNWEPDKFTEAGTPIIDDDVLQGLASQYPEAALLAEYFMVNKRIGQVGDRSQGWLNTYNSFDNRIHGYVNTMGARTFRMTHSKPNVAQVPSGRSPYGNECRECFTVPNGYKLVGCDASGLELRGLAHYLARYDGGTYAKAVVHGSKDEGTDAHTLNMKALGINSRDDAKTWFYAFIYGAGNTKLGAVLGKGPRAGGTARKAFLKNMPAFGRLTKAIEAKVKAQGYLQGLDGRVLLVPSLYSALNTVNQSAGAIIMKRALVILDDMLMNEWGLKPFGEDYEFVANIHDEFQIEVKEEHAELVGQCAREAMQQAGIYYNLRCPLDGDYAIGESWKDTH